MKEGRRHVTLHSSGTMFSKKFSVISRMKILEIILENTTTELDSHTVEELNLAQQKCIIKGNVDMNVRDAICAMLDANITSLPLTNADGEPISVFAMSDLLNIPIEQWDGKVSDVFTPTKNILTCSNTSSIKSVVETMTNNRIHHVYNITDEKATGVVSFIDLIRVLV